ncbi:hypothetical protein C8R45DRAFT_946435 [Mycena sanguinolenta]|nr:hypothetical protein C8R45DRAFT_946435 [Mycena sanguinolenta]
MSSEDLQTSRDEGLGKTINVIDQTSSGDRRSHPPATEAAMEYWTAMNQIQFTISVYLSLRWVMFVYMRPPWFTSVLSTWVAIGYVYPVATLVDRPLCTGAGMQRLKRKRKTNALSKARKRPLMSKNKGKDKAHESDSEPEQGIRVTARSEKWRTGGMFVDEVIYFNSVLESYDIPALAHRVAYILDLTDTPELLQTGRKQLTVDGLIKKECQDSFLGPTGSKAQKSLAKVVILDDDPTCSLASDDFLDDCLCWEDKDQPHTLVVEPIMAAKASEATSVAAIASAFYCGIIETYCKSEYLDSEITCGGRAILRKSWQGKMNGKAYFIGCSNWTTGDSDKMSKTHRFTKIPPNIRESILVKLFKARNHYQNGVHVIGKLRKHECRAQLPILVPIDPDDLRAVIIPTAGVPHSHPSFPRTKIPALVKQKYRDCIAAVSAVGATTLRVDKSSTTQSRLDSKLVQELHPGMINNRKRRDMVKDHCENKFPDGTGLPAVYNEFDKDMSRNIQDRYIHGLAVVHGKPTGTVIGRVWNGIFDAIEKITGKKLNFKVFSTKSKLLGVIGDSEGAQAQGLADVIILRQMNPPSVAGFDTVHFNAILMVIWKMCIVHFNRGVFTLATYINDNDLAYLLGFPYLLSDDKIQQYYSFCADSTNSRLLREKQLECETAQVIKASMTSGVLENPNNSLQACFKNRAQRQERSREKQRELSSETLTRREAKKLWDETKVEKERAQMEIANLRKQIEALTQGGATRSPSASTPKTSKKSQPVADALSDSPMNSLELFPDFTSHSALVDRMSDFDYQGAPNSDIMSPIFKKIIKDHPMYPISGDGEVWATDPYEQTFLS